MRMLSSMSEFEYEEFGTSECERSRPAEYEKNLETKFLLSFLYQKKKGFIEFVYLVIYLVYNIKYLTKL